jgi:hypothetical protein
MEAKGSLEIWGSGEISKRAGFGILSSHGCGCKSRLPHTILTFGKPD